MALAFWSEILSVMSRVLRGGFPEAAFSRAKATAPVSRSPSMILSMMPASSALAAEIGSPTAHISAPNATPARRAIAACLPRRE